VLADADLVAFAASTDLAAAEAFYGGVLGLELVDSTPFAKVFDAHGTQLRVTRVDALAGAAYTVLGWRVEDLDAAVAARGRAAALRREPLREGGPHAGQREPARALADRLRLALHALTAVLAEGHALGDRGLDVAEAVKVGRHGRHRPLIAGGRRRGSPVSGGRETRTVS
jgi:catechol 2,3-dioxygenase-like lactoylglutathione lyase family enzyme